VSKRKTWLWIFIKSILDLPNTKDEHQVSKTDGNNKASPLLANSMESSVEGRLNQTTNQGQVQAERVRKNRLSLWQINSLNQNINNLLQKY